MNNYLVILKASDVSNYGQKWYSQKIEAWVDEKCWAEHYDSNTKQCMKYYTVVLQKHVRSESGIGAIMKFRRWQEEGLSEEYLQ